ncbi:MAG: TIM barrel protein [Planctomycetaceae bacterium]
MNRREFLSTSVIGIAGLSSLAHAALGARPSHRLRFAPHQGMFQLLAGESPLEQIEFLSQKGFTALDDRYLLRRSTSEISHLSQALADRQMTWGAGLIWEDYGASILDNAFRGDLSFSASMSRAMQTAREIPEFNRGIVAPGRLQEGRSRSHQLQAVAEMLQPIAEESLQFGLELLLEPHGQLPGSEPMLLDSIEHAVELCELIGHPSVKIVYDVYRESMNGRDVIDDLARWGSHIGYFRIGDVPGNKEPGTGTFPFLSFFQQLIDQQFAGIIGMDHGLSQPGLQGELAVLESYRNLLDRL